MNYFEEYFAINKYTLSAVGEWPLQSKTHRRIIRTGLFLSTLFQVIGEVNVLYYLDRTKIISDTLPVHIFNGACFLKAINCAWFDKEMTMMLNLIKDFWEDLSIEKHKIHHIYAARGRFFGQFFFCLLYGVALVFCSMPLLPKILVYLNFIDGPVVINYPYPAKFLFDEKNYFIPIYFHMTFTVFILTTLLAGTDALFFAFVEHACGMFSEVGWRLENLVDIKDMDIELTPDESNDRFVHAIGAIVRKHNEAIRFSKLLDAIFRRLFLIVVGFNAGIISTTSLQILHSIEELALEDAFRLIAFVLGQFVHLGFECYVSQDIIDHSLYVGEAVVKTKWYMMSLRARKLLNLISIRSRIPCGVTVGSFFIMSIPFYSDVVRTSMSYFTMLRSTE